MKFQSLRYILLGLLLFPLLAACSGLAESRETSLSDVTWELDSYLDAQGQVVNALPDAQATLEFAAGQLSGSNGCNRYFASYTQDGKNLTLGPAGSTRMACEEARMTQESAFMVALGKVAAYRLKAARLELLDAEGKVQLTFSVQEPLPLAGTTWAMTSLNNGQQAVVSTLEGVDVTAIFESGDRVGGSAGCNAYSAEYKVNGSSLTISQAVSTLMACETPAGVMEQEAAYLKALENAAAFKVRGSTLEIYDAGGILILSFSAASS
jgi:heat shock protein HslJ